MRRTRDDIGRLLLFVFADFGGVEFGCADFEVEGFVEAGGSVADFFPGESEAAEGEPCWASATERVLLSSPHRTPSASSRHSLRPNRTTFNFFARDRRNLCAEMLEML